LAARVVFVIADTVSSQIYARPFNPVVDLYLLADGLYLLKTTVGTVTAWLAAGAALVLLALIVAGAFMLLGVIRRPLQPLPAAAVLVILGVLGVSLRLMETQH